MISACLLITILSTATPVIVRAYVQTTDSLYTNIDTRDSIWKSIYELISFANDQQDNLDSSILLHKKAYRISEEFSFHDGMFHASICTGIFYSEIGQYEDAMKWMTLALTHAVHTPMTVLHQSRTFHNIGSVFMYQGNYNDAVEYFFKAAETAEQSALANRDIADHLVRTYNNIGTALLHMEEYDKALYYLDKGAVLAQNIQSEERLAHILNNKANVWNKKGDTEKAWRYVHQALSLATRNGPSLIEYTAVQTMAEILIAKEQPSLAIPYLKQTLPTIHNINPYYRSGIYYTLGKCYLFTKMYDKATIWLNTAVKEATIARATTYLLQSHQSLAKLYGIRQEYQSAFRHQQEAYKLNDSLLKKQKTEAVSLFEIKYRTAEKDRALIQNQLLISEQQNYLKKKNSWIYGISGGTLLLILLSFSYYRSFRHKQKVHLLKAMITGEEKERTRIGQDLHDGIGGRLAAINMNFGAIKKRYESFPGTDELEQIMVMLDETAEEVRNTAHNLIPDILSRYSFCEAIRLYCEQVSTGKTVIQPQITEGLSDFLNKNVELMLYRIIQELVQNIVKHAHATQAVIEISEHEKELIIIAEDNGTGFDTSAPTKGMGLYNIRNRVKLLHGQITIESAHNIGTSISIIFDTNKLKTIFSDEDQNRNNRRPSDDHRRYQKHAFQL